jgi:hypothetical protein
MSIGAPVLDGQMTACGEPGKFEAPGNLATIINAPRSAGRTPERIEERERSISVEIGFGRPFVGMANHLVGAVYRKRLEV